MSYRIAAVMITDYKRLREIKIELGVDSMWVLLGGENAQGKSSVFDAIEVALGGKAEMAEDPVRHGAEESRIEVMLKGDGAKEEPLTVRRKILPDGTTTLELRDEIGATVRSPQAVLDKLIGARFLDPIAFLGLPAKDQREHLLKLIDKDGAIAKLDERSTRCFDLRTEVNREHKKASAELERLGPVTEPAAALDVVDLSRQLAEVSVVVGKLNNTRAAHERAVADVATKTSLVASAEEAVKRAQAQLEIAREQLAAAQQREAEAAAAVEEMNSQAYDAAGYRASIEQQIAQAQEHNRKVAADAATWKRKIEIEREVERQGKRSKELGAEIEKVKAEKDAILAAAKLPVEGLGVSATGVTLNGAPLSQASGAEKQRVALALAIAANPNLRDVWIRDGALLDDNSLKAITEAAAAASCRVWIERVGDRDPGAIIIHDGAIKDAPPPAQGKLF